MGLDTGPTVEPSHRETASYAHEYIGTWLRPSNADSLMYKFNGFLGIKSATLDTNITPQLLKDCNDIYRTTIQLFNPSKCPALQILPTADQIRSITIETGFSLKQGSHVFAINMLDARGNESALPALLPKQQTEAAVVRGMVDAIREFKQLKKAGEFAPVGLTQPNVETSLSIPPSQSSMPMALSFPRGILSAWRNRTSELRSSERIAGVVVDNLFRKAEYVHATAIAQLVLKAFGGGSNAYAVVMPEAEPYSFSLCSNGVKRGRKGMGWDNVTLWNPEEHSISFLANSFKIPAAKMIENGIKYIYSGG